jgi:hypothetical protein
MNKVRPYAAATLATTAQAAKSEQRMFLLPDLGNSKSNPGFLADLNLLTSSSKSRSFSEF